MGPLSAILVGLLTWHLTRAHVTALHQSRHAADALTIAELKRDLAALREEAYSLEASHHASAREALRLKRCDAELKRERDSHKEELKARATKEAIDLAMSSRTDPGAAGPHDGSGRAHHRHRRDHLDPPR